MKKEIILNVVNKNLLVFTYEEIQIDIRGGLERDFKSLYVTLCIRKAVEDDDDFLPQTINLYNSFKVESFVKLVRERLRINETETRLAFRYLTKELDKYRIEMMELEDKAETQIAVSLSEEDEKVATDFLKSTDLLDRTNRLIGKSGIIGEEHNRLLMYLIFTSRKMNDPLHCISFGKSGTGKTHLQTKVSELIPEEDKIFITSLTENAFYGFGQDDLKNKLLLIEDLTGVKKGLYNLRELQTRKQITKLTTIKGIGGRPTSYRQTIYGPVSVGACTTEDSIYEDNSNRSFLLQLDDSKEQDERIMTYQRKKAANKIDFVEQKEIRIFLQNAQRALQTVTVVNPYAELLTLPEFVTKRRRTNMLYLQLIEAITFYHQYQRKMKNTSDGEMYIETTLEDIKMADELMRDILVQKSDNLNINTRTYLDRLTGYAKENKTNIYTTTEVRRKFVLDEASQRRYHRTLVKEGYIKRRDDIKSSSHSYELLSTDELEIRRKAIEKAQKLHIDSILSSKQNDEVKTSNSNELTKIRH